jgi:hypothetical protein
MSVVRERDDGNIITIVIMGMVLIGYWRSMLVVNDSEST